MDLLFSRVSVLTLSALSLMLSACSSTPPPPPAPVVARPPSYQNGMRLYGVYCARCHDSSNDAPTLDDIEAWDERSFQWESVLKGHVAQGFLEMPPSGGEVALSEQTINDILFFMTARIKALDE